MINYVKENVTCLKTTEIIKDLNVGRSENSFAVFTAQKYYSDC